MFISHYLLLPDCQTGVGPILVQGAHYETSRFIQDPPILPSDWKTWEEYLKLKPGEFTPDQIVTEIYNQELATICHKSIFLNAQGSVKHRTSHGVFISHYLLLPDCQTGVGPILVQGAHYETSRFIQDPPILPSDWKTWEEYLKLKPGEFTPDQIVTEITQNRVKIDKTVARILETFGWYFTSRLIVVIGQFEKWVGTDNPGERWR